MLLAIQLLSGFPHRDDSGMPWLRIEAGQVYSPGRASSAEVIRNFGRS